MLSVAINRAEHVSATVIIKHIYMLMCNHKNKIIINIMLCLLNSTGHMYVEIYNSRPMTTREICLHSDVPTSHYVTTSLRPYAHVIIMPYLDKYCCSYMLMIN